MNIVVPVLSHGSPLSQPGHRLMAARPGNATAQCLPVSRRYNAQRCHRGKNGGCSWQCRRATPSLRCPHRAQHREASAQPSFLSMDTLSADTRQPNVARRQSTLQCQYNSKGHSRTERAILALYRPLARTPIGSKYERCRSCAIPR